MASNGFPTLSIDAERVTFDKLYFGVKAHIPQIVLRELTVAHRDHPLRQATLQAELNPMYDELIISMCGWLLKSQHTEIKKQFPVSVPLTWWDHIKHDMLQSTRRWVVWLARQFKPPTYAYIVQHEVHETRVCPHNNSYFSESAQHIQWLARSDNDNAEHVKF